METTPSPSIGQVRSANCIEILPGTPRLETYTALTVDYRWRHLSTLEVTIKRSDAASSFAQTAFITFAAFQAWRPSLPRRIPTKDIMRLDTTLIPTLMDYQQSENNNNLLPFSVRQVVYYRSASIMSPPFVRLLLCFFRVRDSNNGMRCKEQA